MPILGHEVCPSLDFFYTQLSRPSTYILDNGFVDRPELMNLWKNPSILSEAGNGCRSSSCVDIFPSVPADESAINVGLMAGLKSAPAKNDILPDAQAGIPS